MTLIVFSLSQQLMDGTLAELRQVALGIERKDIVDILNNALNEINAN